jgi:2-oxo-4-hydroxy-4-carboxy-5-ureidoimidazoline decarboxylase
VLGSQFAIENPPVPLYLGAVTYQLAQINDLPDDEFARIIGPVFEHSPWIAQRAASQRPFTNVAELHAAMSNTVAHAAVDEQLALIRAHPDLVGRTVLTPESQGEQAAAGLTGLSAEEVALFDRYNREYQQRFGFPFVICARLNKKEAILEAFPVRLRNSQEEERLAALQEIFKIAKLRLADLITE